MDRLIIKLTFLFLFIILLFGFLLRSHNIYTWPRLGATFDEYAWTWLGINLIQNHTPISWSPLPAYKDKKFIVYQKANFFIVKPYLEHPPFFGLVAGSYALINGASDMLDVDLGKIRGLALILGVLSIFMVYILAAENYGFKIGLISAFIYSVVPTIAVGSRLVQNENFFIPLFLFSLYLILKFIKTQNPWFRNIAAIICGILVLAKIPWISAAMTVVLILLFFKKYKDIVKFLAIFLPIFSIFFIYGIYYDANLFKELWLFQLNRYDLTFNSFFALFTSPYLADRFFIDGWIYFGWISIFLLMLKDIKKNFIIIFPFLVYMAVFIGFIPNEPSHGWYRYPFYPFFAIGIAIFLKEYFNRNHLLTFIFLIFTGLSMLENSWALRLGFSYLVFRSFLILFGISLFPLYFPKTKKIAYLSNYLSLVIIIFLSIWSILKYNEQ